MKTATDLLPVLQKEVNTQEEQITSLIVKDDASLKEASDRIKAVKDLKKKIETERDLFTAPAKEIISAAKAKYDPLTTALAGFEKVLKDKAQAFMTERDAKQTADIAKLGNRVVSGTMRSDTAIRKIEAMPDATKTRTENSGLRVIKRKDVEVVDLSTLAVSKSELDVLAIDGYIVWDMVKVRKDVLAGIPVPGARIIEKTITQSV